ncbi:MULTISPECIES: hypothetical protein [Pseudomonas]|jgi:hypothetical protein|uniref:30S ribosomal protein S3 n=1 Tax=Pseudomonas beijingensis TaxID=2954101 RepID=A0ABY9FG85_9PSED|nr:MULTISPECIES: hypothetical protein [unclassified Pseudomonas]WLH02453.1 hypothetical protein PSH92_06150 [Pseudomonas sp. FP2034]WLH47528.1 hypothetical protein PSH83_06265 [Pseudomonas sp. FP2262]WLI47316.1 hypothetical protein PSH84_10820 [Pseudomonas sp. FP830]
MDYFIIVVTTVAGLYFHGWLYVRIRRWIDRDLALSLAGQDEQKKTYMLQQLARAREQGIKRRDLPQWLQTAAAGYPPKAPGAREPSPPLAGGN